MTGRLDRREVTAALLADRGELLVVAGLGAPSWDVAAVGDHDLNFMTDQIDDVNRFCLAPLFLNN